MSFNTDYLKESLIAGAQYVPFTVRMAVIVFAVSVVIGLIIATVRFYKIPVLSQFFAAFVTIYQGIPLMLAINIYYLVFSTFYDDIMRFLHLGGTIRGANFNVVAYITLIVTTSCLMSETFRGAYKSIEQVQFEAGYSIGLTKFRTLTRIALPQIVPVVLPSMVNWLTGTLKSISIVSIIGIYEIMNGALVPCIRTYSYVEGYIAAALLYWVIVAIIEQAGKILEKRNNKYRRQAV